MSENQSPSGDGLPEFEAGAAAQKAAREAVVERMADSASPASQPTAPVELPPEVAAIFDERIQSLESEIAALDVEIAHRELVAALAPVFRSFLADLITIVDQRITERLAEVRAAAIDGGASAN